MPLLRAPEFWRGPEPSPAARLLAPLARLYAAAAAARLARPAPRAPLPAIVIGGATAGGDGKTPLALAVSAILLSLGERPAFLTRGYGGTARGAPFVVDPARHDARRVGDEALLLARRAPAIVGADRLQAARLAAQLGASVLVLDDGLHSRRLAPDLALLAIDADYGVGNGLCLPAGPLRAPLSALAPILDARILIGSGAPPLFAPQIPLLRATCVANADDAAALAGVRVLAFSGIARPEKFRRSLAAVGAAIDRFHAFPDHHAYSERCVAALAAEARRCGARLVTTEKDAARLGDAWMRRHDCTTLRIDLTFETAQAAALLEQALAVWRA